MEVKYVEELDKMNEKQGANGLTVLVLDSATLGRGDDKLGAQLMENYLRAFAFRDDIPDVIVCYNSGATLAAEDSPVQPSLEVFAQKGTDIIVCRTCLGYYNLTDRLAVGRVGDMQMITEAISRASRLIYV